MKIMFATDGKDLNSKMAKRFGHAAYYLIYNTETKEIDARENHGHDDKHSSLIDLMNEGVTHFLIGNIGPHAFEVLKAGNAKIYLARMMTAKEALVKFEKGEIEELEKSTLKKSIESHDDEHGHNHKHEHKNDKIFQIIKDIEHPEIGSTLVELGMIGSYKYLENEKTVSMVINLPMMNIPIQIRDMILNSIATELAKKEIKLKVALNEMTEEQRQNFFALSQANWKL